ncbi:MAG: hypothetical protein FJ291_28585 [Planctomycetes bacterium]|nr:hypothetical protein [Planctomycetota bacterium]
MVAVKARYENGKVELPSEFTGHAPCEVTVLFPDTVRPGDDTSGDPFVEAAGGWRGLVDGEKLKRKIYEARTVSTRPRVKL